MGFNSGFKGLRKKADHPLCSNLEILKMTKVYVVSDFGHSLPAENICAINMISEKRS